MPIYPADAATQAEIVALVDELLAQHAALNALREQDYVIRTRRDPAFPVLPLFDAQAAGLLRLPADCDPTAQISRVFTPTRFPETVVLRADQLWLEVDDPDRRRYLLNYLARPQWKGRSWDEISSAAVIPETADALAALFAEEAQKVVGIEATLATITAVDAEIDKRVLDLYGITDAADRERILGSAPIAEDADLEAIESATEGGSGPEEFATVEAEDEIGE